MHICMSVSAYTCSWDQSIIGIVITPVIIIRIIILPT